MVHKNNYQFNLKGLLYVGICNDNGKEFVHCNGENFTRISSHPDRWLCFRKCKDGIHSENCYSIPE
nr:hypothetical protein [uncultured Methanolobus sp.]